MANSKKNDPKAIHLSTNSEGKPVMPVYEYSESGRWVCITLLVLAAVLSVAGHAAGIFPIGTN